MTIVFVEPAFPRNQREFARGLAAAGADVIGIGERPVEALDSELLGWLAHYEQVGSVCDVDAMVATVQRLKARVPIERIEATVEAHIMPTAQVREVCGIPGTSTRTAYLCRDKPAMKEVLREGGVPCAASIGSASPDEVREFARTIGYPIILKPRDGAGAAGTTRVADDAELDAALAELAVDRGRSIAVEEFVEGHEGFYDTLTVDGKIVHEFVTHYYPNVLEAMRTRWISPQFITTNRVDDAEGYDEVREMGRKVIELLDIETSATHMEWFYGPKGLRFSEIGCRPPGVGAWDLYCAANDLDLYRDWAEAVLRGRTLQKPSRQFAAGIVTLRPDRDGRVTHYEGLDEVQQRYGDWILDYHLPDAGAATQPPDAGYMANAWIRMRHPDYDELRRMLSDVGETVHLRAR